VNGLDLIRAALAEWRKNRGNETTFYKCQHFDGWYVQWALQGFRDDRSIRVYGTAQIAADASPIFTRHINDKAIQAGDRLYFRYGVPGHIVTAVGWDGDRLLVSNTANGGDTVIALSNNVKIHHADTIDLPFIGASRQNGSNRGIRVENYIHGGGSPAGNPQPEGDGRQWIDLTGWYWYTNPVSAQAKTGFRRPLLEGPYPVIGRDPNGAVQVLSNSLGRIWVHSSALGSAPAPAPAEKRRWVDLKTNWITYGTKEQAMNASRADRQEVSGQHVIVEGDGPYKIFIGTGGGRGYHRWVGSRFTQPPVIWQ
jgi:hypothetical protein